eukprot:c27982_g1_i1 orf=212-550(-)
MTRKMINCPTCVSLCSIPYNKVFMLTQFLISMKWYHSKKVQTEGKEDQTDNKLPNMWFFHSAVFSKIKFLCPLSHYESDEAASDSWDPLLKLIIHKYMFEYESMGSPCMHFF